MNNQKGSILAITIALVLIFALFGLSAIYVSGLQNEAMVKQIASTEAFWLAEGGLNKGIWELNNGSGSWPGWDSIGGGDYETSNPTLLSDDGYYDIRVNSSGGTNPTVLAYGYIPVDGTISKDGNNLAKRVVEVRLSKNTFSYGIMGKEYIKMGGNAMTDSYNSTNGDYNKTYYIDGNPYNNIANNGDVATNGNITLIGNAYIAGDVSIGPNGTFTGNASQVNGTITNNSNIFLPPVVVPQTLKEAPYTVNGTVKAPTTLNGLGSYNNPITGDNKFEAISVTSDKLVIRGPANIYLTNSNSLDISGTGAFDISNSTGTVNIYTDGNVKIAGQGIISTATNSTENFILYDTGSNPQTKTFQIDLTGSSTFFGAIYAPESNITVTGKSDGFDIYGALIGNSITIGGNGFIHYDEALANKTFGNKTYSLQSWQEIY
jgi:Tfp pilus assembly protein PilX